MFTSNPVIFLKVKFKCQHLGFRHTSWACFLLPSSSCLFSVPSLAGETHACGSFEYDRVGVGRHFLVGYSLSLSFFGDKVPVYNPEWPGIHGTSATSVSWVPGQVPALMCFSAWMVWEGGSRWHLCSFIEGEHFIFSFEYRLDPIAAHCGWRLQVLGP